MIVIGSDAVINIITIITAKIDKPVLIAVSGIKTTYYSKSK